MSKIEPREFVLKDGRKCIIRTAEEADAEKVLKQIESVLAEAEYTITTLDNDREDYTIEKINGRIKKHIENGDCSSITEQAARNSLRAN